MPHRPEEPESSVLEKILFALNVHGGVVAYRNTTGAYKIGKRFIRYGLGGKGGADIIAFVSVETFAVAVAIEVKRRKGATSDDQDRWLETARRYGVVTGVARTVEEALALVDEARRRVNRTVAA